MLAATELTSKRWLQNKPDSNPFPPPSSPRPFVPSSLGPSRRPRHRLTFLPWFRGRRDRGARPVTNRRLAFRFVHRPFLRQTVQFGVAVSASVGLDFVDLHAHGVRPRVAIISHSCDVPRHFQPRAAAGNSKTPARELLGDMQVRHRPADRRQLVAYVRTDRVEPIGQFHPGFAALVQRDVPGIDIELFRTLDAGVDEFFIGRIERVVDTEELG